MVFTDSTVVTKSKHLVAVARKNFPESKNYNSLLHEINYTFLNFHYYETNEGPVITKRHKQPMVGCHPVYLKLVW